MPKQYTDVENLQELVKIAKGFQISSFGDLAIAQFEPLTSWTFAYNINPLLVNQEVMTTGTVTNSESSAVLQTGTAADGKARIETIKASRYIPGVGGVARWTTVYDTPKADSLQIQGLMNSNDGWGFGYNGIKFGIFRMKDGVKSWVYQEEWNIYNSPNLNPQKGNIYQISYQWLGYGFQMFSMENKDGVLSPVHVIYYANLNDYVSVTNPNLPLSACAENTGNTTNITLKTPSAVAGLLGDAYNDSSAVQLAEDVTKTITAGTLIPLISFRLGETYKTKTNQLFSQAIRLGIGTDLNKTAVIRAFIGGTVTGGAWAYIYEDGASIEYNKTFTSYTAGLKIGVYPMGKTDTLSIDLESAKFKLFAGQMVTFVVSSTGAGDVSAGAEWKNFM
jgi:hypothetical protein